jgi:hypothetical protein
MTKSASGYKAVSIRCALRRSRNYCFGTAFGARLGSARVVPPRLVRAARPTGACRDLRRGTLCRKRRGWAPGITVPRQLPQRTVFHVKQPPSAASANMWSTLPLSRPLAGQGALHAYILLTERAALPALQKRVQCHCRHKGKAEDHSQGVKITLSRPIGSAASDATYLRVGTK